MRPLLWLLVVIWVTYYTRGMLFNATSITWRALTTILRWWKAIAITLYVLCGQLCIAVPGTAMAYIIPVYVIYPIASIAYSYIADLVKQALSPPAPRLFQYTHTHSNGETFTHTYGEEEMEHIREAYRDAYEQRLREQEREGRENRRYGNATGTGKSKRKNKKRKGTR